MVHFLRFTFYIDRTISTEQSTYPRTYLTEGTCYVEWTRTTCESTANSMTLGIVQARIISAVVVI